MKCMVIGLVGFLLSALACGPAGAWSSAGRFGTASGGGGSWSASGFRGGSASGGGGSWSGTGFRGGTASGGGGSWSAHRRLRRLGLRRWGLLARDQPLWHDGTVSLVSLWHDGLWYDGLRRVPLLRWHLRGVPSAHYRELLWLLVRQLRGLVHRRGGRRRCRGRHGRRGGRSLGQHRRRHVECLLAGYAAGATTTAYAMGAIYATLPTGCAVSAVSGTTYYHCATTWFQPSYGANGVYYRVVPTP